MTISVVVVKLIGNLMAYFHKKMEVVYHLVVPKP